MSEMSKQESINELEFPIEPGVWSPEEFIYQSESLDSIIHLNEQTLDNLNLTYDDIVDALSEMVEGPYNHEPRLEKDNKLIKKYEHSLAIRQHL